MADTLNELLIEVQELIGKLEDIGFGDDTKLVTHNSVTRPTLQKNIADKFLALQALIQGQQAYETKALMDADLAHGENVLARVWNDTVENSGIYGKQGAIGSGSWVKSNYDPLNFSYRSDFSNAARNAGFEPVYLNKYHAKAGTVITADPKNAGDVTITKGVTPGGHSTWYGAWIEVNYTSLEELNVGFIIEADHLAGGKFGIMTIMKAMGGWGGSSNAVYFGNKFNTVVNIFDQIMATGDQAIIDYYSSVNTLYIAVGHFTASVETNNATTAQWKFRARFNRGGVVVASDMTPSLFERIKMYGVISSKNSGVDFLPAEDIYAQRPSSMTLVGMPGSGGVVASKVAESASYSWYGLRVAIDYNNLTDLDAYFYFDYEHVSGVAPNIFLFTSGKYSDWGPSSNAVQMGRIGSGPYNLYDLIIAAGMEGVYGAKNTLYINLAAYNSDNVTIPAAESVWKVDPYFIVKNSKVVASELSPQLEATLSSSLLSGGNYITCWGDSLTAGGGWTTKLAALSGYAVRNGGTGGENSQTIMARQGADAMVVNNITIPADTAPVLIADRDVDVGISTVFGNKVTPLLQSGAHVNPVLIGDVEGTLAWTGSGHSDMTGDWVFSRSVAGSEVVINRPTIVRTAFDRLYNSGIQVVFIGQNGGHSDVADLVLQNRKMLEHSGSDKFIVLGLSSGSAALRADYEAAMRKEFGRRFVSLREYLSSPVYDVDGTTIISCYGIDDAGLTPTQADLDAIATGTVPPQCLSDAVHYTTATKTVIGEMLFKKMTELNYF